MKLQMAGKGGQGANMQTGSDILVRRLKSIGQDEQKLFAQESMPDIPMDPQEQVDTGSKLQRIVIDMSKVGRGLSKWYTITRDDARAKMFFRAVSIPFFFTLFLLELYETNA